MPAFVPKSASVAVSVSTRVPMLEDSETCAEIVLAANCGELSFLSVIVTLISAVELSRKEV